MTRRRVKEKTAAAPGEVAEPSLMPQQGPGRFARRSAAAVTPSRMRGDLSLSVAHLLCCPNSCPEGLGSIPGTHWCIFEVKDSRHSLEHMK